MSACDLLLQIAAILVITEGCAILLWIHSSAWKNQRVPSISASSSRAIAALISHWIFQLLFAAILKIHVFWTHILLQLLLECIAEGSFAKLIPFAMKMYGGILKEANNNFKLASELIKIIPNITYLFIRKLHVSIQEGKNNVKDFQISLKVRVWHWY